MSYDLRIGVRVHNTDIIAVIDEPELSSPTYNLGKMFRACTGWDFKQGEWYNAAEGRGVRVRLLPEGLRIMRNEE